MSSKIDLAAHLALGLTVKLLASPCTLGDVRLFALGRMHLWPEWPAQSGRSRDLVARLLAHRPDELGEDGPLLDRLRQVVRAANDFQVDAQPDQKDAYWDSVVHLVPGAEIDDRIDGWLAELDKLDATGSKQSEVKVTGTSDVEFVAAGASYRVPSSHFPAGGPRILALKGAPASLGVEVDIGAVRTLAQAIDGGTGGNLYEKVAVDGFMERFFTREGTRVTFLPSGPTRLAVAPTGTGKSVFARLVALYLANKGQPVALVVPTIQDVWKEVLRLRQAAGAAHLDLKVVALSSPRSLAERLAEHLEHPPDLDREAAWALKNVAYSCLLSAYVEQDDTAPTAGDEPCTRLRQRRPGSKDAKVGCPFSSACGRFSAFEEAVSADIVVVNHHAFLAGRVPVEVAIDGGAPKKISTAELILRRCVAVFIDEIDGFQNSAIGANSRGLVLSSRGRVSKAIELYTEVERRRAENRIDRSLRFERGRSALLRIINESERLSELINRGEMKWPERGQMTWREAHDPAIGRRLYGNDHDALDRVRRLFDPAIIVDDDRSERLRLALAPLGLGLGDGTLIEDVRTDIMKVLLDWPSTLRRPRDPQQERSLLADRLVLRAALVQLDKALGHLRPQLPGLEQLDVQQAAQLRDDLLGFAPWQPSPTGPLGERLYGYAFAERLGEQGALETRIMSGDPHGLVRELGGLVAHALAGTPRVVVGLSATCRFRGSPRADVLGELLGSVRDEARNVRVHQAPVQARISGVGGKAERLDAARDAAEELWNAFLERYLGNKMVTDEGRGRARALLVTGSYAETLAVAQGLRRAAGPDARIRYLVQDPALAKSDLDALPRTHLEKFGEVPAPAILVGPLSVVARGHNILQPGTQLSALAGICVLTRPVPPSHDADRFLAHLAYNARVFPPEWQGSANSTINAERRDAWRRLRALQRSPATFRHMDPELRRELICDVLVELAQLAGRARRGGTPVDLVFVDGAFQDEVVPWSGLVREVLLWWKERGWFDEMNALHGAFVSGLADYAAVDLT
ncbi:MAG: hypothetical protein Q8P41_15720 [Pseudomonadota bacterium]|nr:hypothetical protein [Pseudomonadota bacterium]